MNIIIGTFPRYTEEQFAFFAAEARLLHRKGRVIAFAPYLEQRKQVERNIKACQRTVTFGRKRNECK